MSVKSALTIAAAYHKRGWVPVPVPYKKKAPVILEWEKLNLSTIDLPLHFNCADQNIGVLLGVPSGGLVDIDMDCPESLALASYFLPPTSIFGRVSTPESHYLVQCNPPPPTKKYQLADGTAEKAMIVELRSTGAQTVFPGSTHESGEVITWANDIEPVLIGRDDLTRRVAKLAAASLLLRHWVKGQRDELATALCGALLRAKWTPVDVDRFIEIIATVAGSEIKFKAEGLQEKLQSKTGHVYGLPKLREIVGAPVAGRIVEWLALIESQEVEGFPLGLVLSARDLLARDIPPREFLIEGVLAIPSLVMLFAWRGLGKTWVALAIALAVSSGTPWFKWQVPKARRVLFIDGEMPAADLQARVRDLCGDDVPELLEFISSEFFYNAEKQPLTLNNVTHQERLRLLLETLSEAGRRPELIIFDNLSSMSFGIDENSNSEQDGVLAFLRELRHLGHAVLIVHHSGKGGDQRGASRHEDFLDLSIKLTAPDDNGPQTGARFIMEFTKTRGRMPSPSVLDCSLTSDAHGRLVWAFNDGEKKVSRWIEVLKFVADKTPATQKEIAVALGVSAATVGEHLRMARRKELLDGMLVTSAGEAYLAKVYAPKGGSDEPSF